MQAVKTYPAGPGDHKHLHDTEHIQPALKVGRTDDPYEREANRVADTVMRMPDNRLQRQPAEEQVQREAGNTHEALYMRPLGGDSEMLQMKCKECEEKEKMRMKPAGGQQGDGFAYAPPEITDQIHATRGRGTPLSPDIQQEMSQKMGADFRSVQVHTGAKAAQMNQAMGARAFTVGQDIYFNTSEYTPKSNEGKRLLAHELVHTVQQSPAQVIQRAPTLGGSAPASANWRVVPNAHEDRVNAAIDLVKRVVSNNRCETYFNNNCTDGRGANSLQHAYDNAVVYNLNTNDTTYGSSRNNTNDIAYNNTSYNTGRWFLASTLLHEMFHTCDPVIDAQDEIDAENAVEVCRLYTPVLSSVTPGRAQPGKTVTLEGISFGASQGPRDKVFFNNIDAGAASKWGYKGAAGNSAGEIKITVPAGAVSGTVKVVNNGIPSNEKPFLI